MTAPTVYLVLGESAIAFDTRGELLETVEWSGGTPVWTDAGICDHRGSGGQEGYRSLHLALTHAEDNARLCGLDIVRLPS